MFNRNADRPTSSVPEFLAGLLPLLLAVGTPEHARAEDIRIGGTGAALGTMQLLAQAYAKTAPEVRVTVLPSIGSSGGIKALLAGAVQLAVSSRVPNENESKAGAVAVEYGRTPFVFATATSSKVTGLTTQNLVDFYSGKLECWRRPKSGSSAFCVASPIDA